MSDADLGRARRSEFDAILAGMKEFGLLLHRAPLTSGWSLPKVAKSQSCGGGEPGKFPVMVDVRTDRGN